MLFNFSEVFYWYIRWPNLDMQYDIKKFIYLFFSSKQQLLFLEYDRRFSIYV